LLDRARRADAAAYFDEWMGSLMLQPPDKVSNSR